MKAYVGFKFKEDYSDRPFIENMCTAIEAAGLETFVFVKDVERWGQVKIAPGELMPLAFSAIDSCDVMIIEFSEKGVGLGIEAGYAYAKSKPIVVIAREGSEISDTLKGIAKQIIFYRQPEDIKIPLGSSVIIKT